ncbi:MAG: DUF29 domain-containing protein [Gammaproteobacteria bacterium]|nr:MAG: DUF29 domain-containing protein [Gammaproteobacteria bacterium]RKZ45504.1 MAG: DUF29 domain-containing protein [Gammaproteobacteria bacterium]RKZ76627.1 MAG: DUF29 domain-containing protein [Gammaproteobacteria bacterium]
MNVAYEQDFYSWTNNNVELLREGKLSEIDRINIAEELEAMGKSQQHALVSRLAVLLMHLLKWQYQPEKCSRSWELTIIEQRHEIFELIEDSPSLKHTLEEKLAKAYQKSLIKAERETGIRYTKFPHSCPYTLEEVLDKQFYPEKSDV